MNIQLPDPLAHDFTPSGPPTTWPVVETVFDRLDSPPLDTADELDAFLAAWNETSCWVWDEVAKSRVAVRVHTDDEEAQERWEALSSGVLPNVSRRTDRLRRRLLENDHIKRLEESPYASFVRQVRTEVELFREENVELLEREQQLCNRYHQISGGWTFPMNGEQHTLSQMQPFLSSPDRAVREEAWRSISNGIAETSEQLEDLFEQLFELRAQIGTTRTSTSPGSTRRRSGIAIISPCTSSRSPSTSSNTDSRSLALSRSR